jgi:hypothetical protein
MRRPLCALATLAALASAHAGPTKTWMSVMLDGRKVGTLVSERTVQGDTVTTSQAIDMRVTRGSTPLVTHSEAVTTEQIDGQPLAFHASRHGTSAENSVDGIRRDDGTFQVTTAVGSTAHVDLLAWTPGATLPEGQRLAIVAAGFAPGTRYRLTSFDPMKRAISTLELSVVGDEMVDLPGGTERLHHLRQTLAGSASPQAADMWVNDQGRLRRGVSPLLGFRMEVAACDEACATSPDQDIDVLRSAMLQSPRALPNGIQDQSLTYVIQVRDGLPNPFPVTDEQSVRTVGNGLYELIIGRAQRRPEEPGPIPEDTQANPWVQSDAPEVIEMAKQAVGGASSDLSRMRRLRSFLTGYIDQKGLDVGYASALETIQSRHGDCTEHAVLLAALARSQGIPTRIVTGLVYTQRFAGASRVFVPHTWVQAWIDKRWVSFDSAEARFDSTHIALGVGSGDPWRFFASLSSLGHMQVNRVAPSAGLPDLMQRPSSVEPRESPSFSLPVQSSNPSRH